MFIGQIARDVLDQDASPEAVLHAADTVGDVNDRLFGIRKGQQVVRKVPIKSTPAQMVGYPCGLKSPNQYV